MGYNNLTVQDFAAMLKSQSDTYFSSKEELVSSFENVVYNEIHPKLSNFFWTLPEQNVT